MRAECRKKKMVSFKLGDSFGENEEKLKEIMVSDNEP